jgi:hypothetical protein
VSRILFILFFLPLAGWSQVISIRGEVKDPDSGFLPMAHIMVWPDTLVTLTDENFNEQLYSEDFRVFPTDFSEGDTVAVYLSNIREEYYNFIKLRVDNRFSFVEFLGEPINYPTNVEGGKGFFNLYLPDIRLYRLEEKD